MSETEKGIYHAWEVKNAGSMEVKCLDELFEKMNSFHVTLA